MKSNYIYTLIALMIGLVSCESIVDVKVNETEPCLVVDAWLTHTTGDQTIRLTTTQPYFDNNFTPGVTDAEVTVTDGSGNEFIFTNEGDGNYVYASADSFGTVGESYFLEVLWGGNTYTSYSMLNRQVGIDSIVYNTDEPEETHPSYYAEYFGRDPDGVGDAYWLKAWVNGKYLNKPSEIYTFDDASFSEDDGSGIPFIFPLRVLPNPGINDVNGEEIPLYSAERTFPISEDRTIDFYESKARVTDNRLEIIFDEDKRKEPLGEGVESYPLDGQPYYMLDANTVAKHADSLYLELHTITPDAYFFLARLQQETDRPSGFGALFSTPPSDLPTNISVDDEEVPVVGFFNVGNVSSLGQKLTPEVTRIDD